MRFKVLKASVKGSFHNHNKMPNQDFLSTFRCGGLLCAVVCDGLGSHKKSDIGARCAVDAVKKTVKQLRSGIIFEDVPFFLKLVHNNWLMALKEYKPGFYGTTCLIAVIKDKKVVAAQIGDGGLMIDGKKVFQKNSSLFSNQTLSLSSMFDINKWQWKVTEVNKSILLCTDGVSEDIKNKDTGSFIEWLSDVNRDLVPNYILKKELKNWPNKKNGDDKTLIYLERVKNEERKN